MKNRTGFRVCSCCKTEKELNSDNFCSDKNRAFGFSYRCRACDSSKKDHRRNRYQLLSEEQKDMHKNRNRLYTSEGYGRATALICAYRKIDRAKSQTCDLDRDFMVHEIFNQPCYYCDDTSEKIGCDRIDNSQGHLKSNVVPCCKTCNTARMDNFTHEEMIVLGKAIAEIKALRVPVIAAL